MKIIDMLDAKGVNRHKLANFKMRFRAAAENYYHRFNKYFKGQ